MDRQADILLCFFSRTADAAGLVAGRLCGARNNKMFFLVANKLKSFHRTFHHQTPPPSFIRQTTIHPFNLYSPSLIALSPTTSCYWLNQMITFIIHHFTHSHAPLRFKSNATIFLIIPNRLLFIHNFSAPPQLAVPLSPSSLGVND